ncbi:MAG: hypothetical protein JW892_14260 [Anaerolineae bacterium]|nr:hypothetical protein [Anaerolineae bacterium]
MYHRGMIWEEYLEHEGFKDDIVHGMERQTREIVAGQIKAAQQLASVQQQAAEATAHTLDRGFGALVASQQEMNAVMNLGFASVSYGLDRVAGGIEALRADFDWAMAAVLWKLEIQQATLQGILAILQAPLNTEAKELRKRAEDAYVHGWYDEALADFLESERRNYQDFAVHQAIGNIYLYHCQPAELDKAREYYLQAGKYARPCSAYHSARAFLHAGFVCYLQRDDAAAIEYAHEATEIYPKLVEAFYNHAKFAAAAGQAAIAIPSLETAIRADRNYAVKARADADFEKIEAAVRKLMERLCIEARQVAEAAWHPVRVDLDRYALPDAERDRIQRLRREVERLLGQNRCFGYLDALKKIEECRGVWESLQLPERDRLEREAIAVLGMLQSEMADHVLTDAMRQRLSQPQAEAVSLLRGNPTHTEAKRALDLVNECQGTWLALRLPERDQLQLQVVSALKAFQHETRRHYNAGPIREELAHRAAGVNDLLQKQTYEDTTKAGHDLRDSENLLARIVEAEALRDQGSWRCALGQIHDLPSRVEQHLRESIVRKRTIFRASAILGNAALYGMLGWVLHSTPIGPGAGYFWGVVAEQLRYDFGLSIRVSFEPRLLVTSLLLAGFGALWASIYSFVFAGHQTSAVDYLRSGLGGVVGIIILAFLGISA